MCCNRKNRAVCGYQMNYRSATSPSGLNAMFAGHKESVINTLVGAVNSLAIQTHQGSSQHTNQVPVYPEDYKEKYPMDEPPPYERISREPITEVATREITNTTLNSQSQAPSNAEKALQYQAISPQIQKLVEVLTIALAAYQSGSGRRMFVRRALKALRNALYEEEVARRQAKQGRLRCGERSNIWREVKAIDFGY